LQTQAKEFSKGKAETETHGSPSIYGVAWIQQEQAVIVTPKDNGPLLRDTPVYIWDCTRNKTK
jgi:hypothetical protein